MELSLPRHLFENKTEDEAVSFESANIAEHGHESENVGKMRVWKIRNISWGDGIYTHIVGADFPSKGNTPPDVLVSLNIFKRVLSEIIRTANIKEIYPSLILFAIEPISYKKRVIKAILDSITRIGEVIMRQFFLKDEYKNKLTKEIETAVILFSKEFGIYSHYTPTLSKLISHIFEYDNAYRLRLQDIFMEINTSELLGSTRRECLRLIQILIDRDVDLTMRNKFKAIKIIVGFMLLSHTIRELVRKVFMGLKRDNIFMDDSDRYWACHREDYNFFGKNIGERKQLLKDNGFSYCSGELINV